VQKPVFASIGASVSHGRLSAQIESITLHGVS
jgi:hypothetical protein